MGRERARRQYGTGTVHKRPDGKWIAMFEAGYTDQGTRRRIKVTADSEKEVKIKLKRRMSQFEEQGATDVSVRTTVKAWSDEWLAMTQTRLRPKPWATDASTVKLWIVPTIGHRRLGQLTPADVRAVHTRLRDAGRSSSTAHRAHVTLMTMLRAAVLEGHQIPARVFAVKAPPNAPSDRQSMLVPEALRLLHAASFLPHGSRWAMAFLHGPRQGECLGLTWSALDLDAGTVTIEWALQALPYKVARDRTSGFRIPDGYDAVHLADRFHLVRPKTNKGFRVSPLVPAMREALRDWREVAPPNPHGLVWARPDGRPIDDRDDRAEFHELQRSAGVEHPSGRLYTPHECRHTTATVLMEAGVDPHQATAIMGHSSIVTTRGYQHPSQQPALAALEAVAGRLSIDGRDTA